MPLDTDALCFEYKLKDTHQIILTMCKCIVVLGQTSGHSPTPVSKICTYRFLGKSRNIFWYFPYVVSWLPTVCNSIFLSQKWIPSAQQTLRCLDSLAKNYTEIDMHLKKNWSQLRFPVLSHESTDKHPLTIWQTNVPQQLWHLMHNNRLNHTLLVIISCENKTKF